MRLSTSSWICCAVAPGQITITVIDGTEKFGSSSWPSFVKPSTPPMRDREDQEQHDGAVVQRPFGEVEGFHRAACFVSAVARGAPGSATRKPGAIFCTPAVTTSSPAGGPDTSTSSLR